MILPVVIFILSGRWAKIKKITAFLLITVFLFRLWQTTGCQHFRGFYFNPLAIKINVESQRDLDSQRLVARIFHNKVIVAPIEISKSFAKVIDPQVLLDLLGPAGLVFLILALAQITKTRNRFGFTHLTVVLIAVFFSLTVVSPQTSFFAVALSLYSFSLWGIKFKVSKYLSLLLIVLIFLNLWYFAINWQMPALCDEIFFN
ncbi:hypothetical protein HYW40_02455 [Candidatus Curtissbacteria bacterium]|nr:hypothetical protein [Candidatus Curtissbacteria bacterium]